MALSQNSKKVVLFTLQKSSTFVVFLQQAIRLTENARNAIIHT